MKKNYIFIGLIFVIVISFAAIYGSVYIKNNNNSSISKKQQSDSITEEYSDHIIEEDFVPGEKHFEVCYAKECSLEECLNMSIKQLNQLKSYRTQLLTDNEAYMSKVTNRLYKSTSGWNEWEDNGTGVFRQTLQYDGTDGSRVVGNSAQYIYSHEDKMKQTKREDIDYQSMAEEIFSKIEFGIDSKDFSWKMGKNLNNNPMGDAEFALHYYIEGYPFTKVSFQNEGNKDREQLAFCMTEVQDRVLFSGTDCVYCEWYPRQTVLEENTIEGKYQTFDDIRSIMENLDDMWDLEEYTRFLVTDIACEYTECYTLDTEDVEGKVIPVLVFYGVEELMTSGKRSGIVKNTLVLNLVNGQVYMGFMPKENYEEISH